MNASDKHKWLELMGGVADALIQCGPTPVAQLASLTKMVKKFPVMPVNSNIALEWGTVNLRVLAETS